MSFNHVQICATGRTYVLLKINKKVYYLCLLIQSCFIVFTSSNPCMIVTKSEKFLNCLNKKLFEAERTENIVKAGNAGQMHVLPFLKSIQ